MNLGGRNGESGAVEEIFEYGKSIEGWNRVDEIASASKVGGERTG